MSKLLEAEDQFEELQNKYQKYLRKVDADIINHLFARQGENSLVTAIYMLEVFTKEGTDSQKAKNFIFHKTGTLQLQ